MLKQPLLFPLSFLLSKSKYWEGRGGIVGEVRSLLHPVLYLGTSTVCGVACLNNLIFATKSDLYRSIQYCALLFTYAPSLLVRKKENVLVPVPQSRTTRYTFKFSFLIHEMQYTVPVHVALQISCISVVPVLHPFAGRPVNSLLNLIKPHFNSETWKPSQTPFLSHECRELDIIFKIELWGLLRVVEIELVFAKNIRVVYLYRTLYARELYALFMALCLLYFCVYCLPNQY